MLAPSHSEHRPTAMEEAEKLHDLIIRFMTNQTGLSTAASAVMRVVAELYCDKIDQFVSCFGDKPRWWILPMLPAEQYIPFVTSPLYGDDYHPIINVSDDDPPDWTAFFDPDRKWLSNAPEGKKMSVRQAVDYVFNELAEPDFCDDSSVALIQLSGKQVDGTWITVLVEFTNVEMALKEVHDTVNFPMETTVKRVEVSHRTGLPIWVYEVNFGSQQIAQYALFLDAQDRKELDLALQAEDVAHYDFVYQDQLRVLRSERFAKKLESAMPYEGSSEKNPSTSMIL